MVGDQPLDAVVIATFFISRQSDDQVAVRNKMFLPEPNECGYPYCSQRFVVGGAAAVKKAKFFQQFERIDGPVLPQRLDNIQMRDQQQRLSPASTTVPHDEISLARIRTENLNVGFRKPRSLEASGHRLCRLRRVAGGGGGV